MHVERLPRLLAKVPMQAIPVSRRSGATCPSGYTAQGNLYVPLANAKPAVLRSGTCPSGYPKTAVQLCLVHMVRHSLKHNFVWTSANTLEW